MENGQMFAPTIDFSELSEQSNNDTSLSKAFKINQVDELVDENGGAGAPMISSLQISKIKKTNGALLSETSESEAQSEVQSEDDSKENHEKEGESEGEEEESGSDESRKEESAFSEEDGLSNYECGESSGTTDTDNTKVDDDDSDFEMSNKSGSEEEISSDEINFKKKKDRKKDRYWEGKEEMYGVRRSHRDNKKKNYRALDDSESDNSNDDSAAFFKSSKRKGTRGYRNLSESDESKSNSDYSPSEDAWTRKKKKKYRRVKKPVLEYVERAIRTRKKQINYQVPEETDPLGSGTDEEDLIYLEVDENQEPEEPVEKIEKVLTDRIGPSWEVGDMTALSAGGNGLKCMDTEPSAEETKSIQYYIKWSRFSHIHNTWETEKTLEEKKCKGMMILQNYIKKLRDTQNWKRQMSPEDREYYDVHEEMQLNLVATHTTVNRIVHHACQKDDDGKSSTDYLVKWHGLPYSEATWEKDDYLMQHHSDTIEEYEKIKNADTKPTKNISKILNNRPKFKKLTEQPSWIPEGLELRDYQVDGLNWLALSWIKGNSGILADEMGLGKTIQTIVFLNFLFKNARLYGPFLLVVPLSTMRAWEREFKKWAPNMNTIIYIGDQASRAVIQDHEWKMPNGTLKFNAVVTSYEIILKDEEFFGAFPWAVLAVDEAHRLKNDQSSLYKVLINFKTYHRLLITGTPLQNSLKELWALLHFICPNLYSTFEEFEAVHGNMQNMNSEALGRIHKELEPYLFRRVKKDVEKSLPGKTEQILRVDMTAKQKQYYKWILTRNFKALNRENKGSQGNFMNILMELKKCCNHCELTVPLEAGAPEHNRLPDLIKGSGKLWLLDKLLERCNENGNRVLIFSQMVRLLDLISEYLELKKYRHQRLDGGIKGEQRAQALDHFNAEESTDFCFLLSTRAGGLGINLATADTVVIFDSDWNPQNDLQAMARAHRIGQKKKVSIYRLITKNSVEEDIIERAKKKMILDHLVIQRMDTTGRTVLQKSGPNKNIPFNKDELTAILKFGAVDLFKDENEGDTHLEHLNIDTVLKEAETREQEEEEQGVGHDLLSQFKVANFTIEEELQPGWNSIIPADQIEAMEIEKEIPLYIAPRRKHKVNYSGTLNRKENSDTDSGGETSGRSKRRKLSGPKHKKKKSRGSRDETYDEASMFTDAEIRKFVKSFRKFGPPLERLKEIGKDACLSASLPELESLVECIHRKCDEAEGYAMNMDGSHKKGLTILVGGCTFPMSHIKGREEQLNSLSLLPRESNLRYKWRLDKKTKPVVWDIDWTEEDDSLLLIGVYNYGLGNWENILKDEKLHLGAKISLEGDLKPKAEHLQTRAEYLLKNMSKLVTKSPVKEPPSPRHAKKKSSRKRKMKVVMDEEQFRVEEEEVKVGEVVEKKKKKSKKLKKEKKKKKIISSEGPTEWSDATFKKCKEMMRPVRKTLRMLENPDPDLSKKEQLRQTKSYLLTIGDQIEKAGTDKSDVWKEEWTQSLWVFVSQFTPIGAKKLKTLYNKALVQQGPDVEDIKPSKKRKR